ncbi:hypothetical protein LWI28_009699 [Acer negundo]|uniref:Response regulatory domain-containing protein n=1 Tax=Acer negundo TaxID=4023 RepID=A0AAD5J8U3_ACENE|nr:hypothetical protein LWI28_009699 [Acer negundo]
MVTEIWISIIYAVTETTKADEALEILRESKEKYDLVITDVIRLDMDGFRLLEIVSLEMDIPVVLVTAEDNQSSIMKGIMHGARDFLLKPVRIQEIKNIWQHVVRKRLSTIEKSSITRDIINSKESRPLNKLKEKVIIKNEDEDDEANSRSSCQKKPRLKWSLELHRRFVNAVQQLGDGSEPAAPRSFPFCSYTPNACFNTTPQAPGQASVQIGTVLQHAIATGHAQNSFSASHSIVLLTAILLVAPPISSSSSSTSSTANVGVSLGSSKHIEPSLPVTLSTPPTAHSPLSEMADKASRVQSIPRKVQRQALVTSSVKPVDHSPVNTPHPPHHPPPSSTIPTKS